MIQIRSAGKCGGHSIQKCGNPVPTKEKVYEYGMYLEMSEDCIAYGWSSVLGHLPMP